MSGSANSYVIMISDFSEDTESTRSILAPTKKVVYNLDPNVKKPPRTLSGVVKFKKAANAVIAANRIINPVTQQVRVSSKLPWLLKFGDFGTSLKLDAFELVKTLGTGLMGTVRLAKMKDYSVYVALKSIRKDFIIKHNDTRHINNERELLSQMTSNFCVRMFGTFQDSKSVYFILEYTAGGELFRLLSNRDLFCAEACKFYLIEIFCALEHVHSLGYVYRDLKPEVSDCASLNI